MTQTVEQTAVDETDEIDGVPTWSITTPLMRRSVCPVCDHMHRDILVKKCSCCRDNGYFGGY